MGRTRQASWYRVGFALMLSAVLGLSLTACSPSPDPWYDWAGGQLYLNGEELIQVEIDADRPYHYPWLAEEAKAAAAAAASGRLPDDVDVFVSTDRGVTWVSDTRSSAELASSEQIGSEQVCFDPSFCISARGDVVTEGPAEDFGNVVYRPGGTDQWAESHSTTGGFRMDNAVVYPDGTVVVSMTNRAVATRTFVDGTWSPDRGALRSIGWRFPAGMAALGAVLALLALRGERWTAVAVAPLAWMLAADIDRDRDVDDYVRVFEKGLVLVALVAAIAIVVGVMGALGSKPVQDTVVPQRLADRAEVLIGVIVAVAAAMAIPSLLWSVGVFSGWAIPGWLTAGTAGVVAIAGMFGTRHGPPVPTSPMEVA